MNNKSDFIAQKEAAPSPRGSQSGSNSSKSQIDTVHIPEHQVVTIQKVVRGFLSRLKNRRELKEYLQPYSAFRFDIKNVKNFNKNALDF